MKKKVLSIKDMPVHVEIADTEPDRLRGLMGRDQLSDGHGMLFVFPEEQQLGFWMKNTLIPLSIAFISSDGAILNIEDMQPHDLKSKMSMGPAKCALEVPQGWFKSMGIHAGDIVSGIEKNFITESQIRKIIREAIK